MVKKSKTDSTRAERKSRKRAAEDAIPDLPGDENRNVNDEVEVGIVEERSKKRKRGAVEGEVETREDGTANELNGKAEKKLKKEKRLKKEEDRGVPLVEEALSKKSKKRKLRDEDVSESMDLESKEKEEVSKRPKKDKKSSKDLEAAQKSALAVDVATDTIEPAEAPKKSKKERKAERRAAEQAAKKDLSTMTAEMAETSELVNGHSKPDPTEEKKSKKNNRNREKKRIEENGSAATTIANGEGESVKATKDSNKPTRFIVFVGNLPFTTTKASLTSHFSKLHPSAVRLLTQKDDARKCKGCAFVEFDGYDHMKTCLKVMHHSMFNDGISPARKINVELTAGGGGNTKDRKEKIRSKNFKLNEERIRKIHEEEKVKATKAIEAGKDVNGAAAIDESAVHPSRRRLVPNART